MVFENITQEKKDGLDMSKFETYGKYALYKGFLLPKELDELDKQGWQLLTFGATGGKYGYYFIKKR
jgi:hypothetical protein